MKKTQNKNFTEQFDIMFPLELALCDKDPERYGCLIEQLARALGFTIAMATNGSEKGIEEFVYSVEQYIYSEAFSKIKLAKFLNGANTKT